MGNEAVPEVEGERGVGAAESGDEMVFERADGTFGSVGSMEAGWHDLEVDCFLVHELLECIGALIVQAL